MGNIWFWFSYIQRRFLVGVFVYRGGFLMGGYVFVGFMFAVLLGVCCFGSAARDWESLRKYEEMLDEHQDDAVWSH